MRFTFVTLDTPGCTRRLSHKAQGPYSDIHAAIMPLQTGAAYAGSANSCVGAVESSKR